MLRNRKKMDVEQAVQMLSKGMSQVAVAKACGVSPSTLRNRLAEIRKDGERVNKLNLKGTLCWVCKRSSGPEQHQCSWAQRFQPVDGWDAEISLVDQSTVSYHVNDCPLFEREERRR